VTTNLRRRDTPHHREQAGIGFIDVTQHEYLGISIFIRAVKAAGLTSSREEHLLAERQRCATSMGKPRRRSCVRWNHAQLKSFNIC